MPRIWKPEVFQGNLNSTNYFEGWYIKQSLPVSKKSIAFIPGISLSEPKHAFIQINDETGTTYYVSYPLELFSWNKNEFRVSIGNSVFSRHGAKIEIEDNDVNVHGILEFKGGSLFRGSLLAPGMMGPLTFLPFLECYHGVVSMNHFVDGIIVINGVTLDFKSGKGYIEKDWGSSFPEKWIWMHANSFSNADRSCMLSIAQIPWLGRSFTGFTGFLHETDTTSILATWSGARITNFSQSHNDINVSIKDRDFTIQIYCRMLEAGELKAPVKGRMSRTIKESIQAEMSITKTDRKGTVLYEDHSSNAGLEITGDFTNEIHSKLK